MTVSPFGFTVTERFCPASIGSQFNNIVDSAALQANIDKFKQDAPTNLRIAHGSDCTTSNGTQSCTQAGFGLLLAYSYDKPDAGFRIYRYGPQPIYVGSVHSGFDYVVPAPSSGDFDGQCFFVVAVYNSIESNPSNSVCAKSSDSLHDVKLSPDHAVSYVLDNYLIYAYALADGIPNLRTFPNRDKLKANSFDFQTSTDSNRVNHDSFGSTVPAVGYMGTSINRALLT